MQERTGSTLLQRLAAAMLLAPPARVQRERAYRSMTVQQSLAVARRRAANKRARASRRINRGRS